MSDSWHSYPKVYALGHAAVADLMSDIFEDGVIVEEKVDGSQFSFGKFAGELRCRSRGKEIVMDAPEKLFTEAVEVVKTLGPKLNDGWTYRAEYLKKPKHNALAYDRIPLNHLVLFDINTGHEEYIADYRYKKDEADRLGIDCVPNLTPDKLTCAQDVMALLETTSLLGGQKIEGVVIKNYKRFGRDGKALMGKYVSEAFKEVHGKTWSKNNPGPKDLLAMLTERYHTETRWNKAVQHLRDRGELTNSPKDIGNLIKEIQQDTLDECKEDILLELWRWAKPKIARGIICGAPEWYKQKLLEAQFDGQEEQQEETAPAAEAAEEEADGQGAEAEG
jgi:hypothetical protein